MAANTQIQVYIGGKLIPAFKNLKLHQEIDAHHDFEITCRRDVLETLTDDLSSESINFLGEVFLLKIQSTNGFSDDEILEFKGIVTNINSVKGFYQKTGDVVHIKGKSCSVITDDGPHFASHQNVGLSEILERTFSGYDKSLLKFNFSPNKTSPIHYSVQQEESAFQYTSRLASQYGEWFYYNGLELIFGKPENKEAVPLKYGYDLLELSLNLEAIPNNFKYITNDYLNDTHHAVRSQELPSGSRGLSSIVNQRSGSLFKKETQVFVSAHDDPHMKSRIDEQILLQKKANDVNQVKVTGRTNNPSVNIGSIIVIDGESSSYGRYRITKIDHTCGENGRYENSFEAITADTEEVYPKTSINAYPTSKSQTAVVVDNVDPDGMGRVKIQYEWQKSSGETSPWIRQSSLAGGPGQGMYFVPEIGDEVVVSHERDNAESPIVQGSVTNSSSVPESFKSDNNHLKAIKTRSGNQVTLNDADGSVTIADPSGNTITMGGNGEITINAPNKITFSSTDIVMEASNDLTVNAGNNISSTAATDITTSAGANMNSNAGADMSSSAGANLSMDAGSDLSAKAGAKASINGTKSVSVFGKRVSITGMIMTNIQSGAIMTIVTAGVLNITGAAKNLINGAKVKVLGGKVEIN